MLKENSILKILIWLVLLTNSIFTQERPTDETSKRIVCYCTSWSAGRSGIGRFTPKDMDPNLCTHMLYAFAAMNITTNSLQPLDRAQDIDKGGYAELVSLKERNKNLKTLLAVGGWLEASRNFSALAASKKRRSAFVKSSLSFLRQYNFDGLDVDWQYPADERRGGVPEDKENSATLFQDLREAFDAEAIRTGRPRLLLTMVVPSGIDYIQKGYDLPKLNKYVDFMSIVSYDYHTAHDEYVNHHSPLYSLQALTQDELDPILNTNASVDYYLKNGINPEKINIGIPTYGRSYSLFDEDQTSLGSVAEGPGIEGEFTREAGYLSHYEICLKLKNNTEGSWTVVRVNESIVGPYAYSDKQWVSYDDDQSARIKGMYAKDKGLGGIMFWTVGLDDFRGLCYPQKYPLVRAGREGFLGTQNQPEATPSTTQSGNPDSLCQITGLVADPEDCAKYFACTSTGSQPEKLTCPSGFLFNKNVSFCDYMDNVRCDQNSTTAVKPTRKPQSSTGTPTLSVKSSTVNPSKTPVKPNTSSAKPPTMQNQNKTQPHPKPDQRVYETLNDLIKRLNMLTIAAQKTTPRTSGKTTMTPTTTTTTTTTTPTPKPTTKLITTTTSTTTSKPTTTTITTPKITTTTTRTSIINRAIEEMPDKMGKGLTNDLVYDEEQETIKSFYTLLKKFFQNHQPCDNKKRHKKLAPPQDESEFENKPISVKNDGVNESKNEVRMSKIRKTNKLNERDSEIQTPEFSGSPTSSADKNLDIISLVDTLQNLNAYLLQLQSSLEERKEDHAKL